jgi:LuxR family transcriptional regulator, maltose regulon positive regulatory protein
LQREWNKLDAAEAYLARGMELIQGTLATEADVIMRGYLTLARVQQAQGEGEAALATLDAFVRLARERQLFPLLIEPAAALQARLQLMQGDLPAALHWAEGSGLSSDDALSFPREMAYLTLARVRIAAGQAEAMLPLLQRLLADAEANARLHSAIEILVLQALAYDARNDRARALTALEHALALAEPEGYVRSFVDEGAPMRTLLLELRAHGMMQAYVDKLLAAFSDFRLQIADCRLKEEKSAIYNLQSAMVEPLSERELEVLGMVAAGCSNGAIAQALSIEVGTVKRHVHNLLDKLGAHSRTEAVARARELGLL